MQKPKSARRRKAEADPANQQDLQLPKLTEDEKGDLVNQAVEELQDAIQKVSTTRLCVWGTGLRLRPVLQQPSVPAGVLASTLAAQSPPRPPCSLLLHRLQTRSNGEKDVDDIRTLMEEVDLRIKETKQQTYEFKRDVILGACVGC
jgi:hypothetical protein